MSCEVRASGGSAGPLVVTAGTWRGEPGELWSPGAGGVLGRKPLAPGGARRRDRWVAARGERQRCSNGEGRRVVARGDRRGGRWRCPWGPGSDVWGGSRGEWGLGFGTVVLERRGVAHGDRRGGGWRHKGIGGVALRSAGVGTDWWLR
jgi:hypothetical protein